ncbi:MAG: putative DNA binding domain-containing protein [Christensenellaceae bacterium]|jgi:ATP-dependent DNA helicase RecG|nr:putative DNA binding domain-containing protein [Christensenellaceae bacterium]
MFEGREVEYKREVNDKVNKVLLSFLNTDGGTLYIGIEDDEFVTDLNNLDETMIQVCDSFRDSVIPDPTPYLKGEVVTHKGKPVVKITVARGTMTPYSFKSEGLVPKGIYVRVSSNSVQATRDHIRQMIRESSGDVFVEQLSINQNLTFEYADKIFVEKGVGITDNHKRTLGIISADGRYTNLGLLLSDQCPWAIKAAIFQGTTKKLFKDRKEFSGSIFKQIDDCLTYLNVFNKISSVFKGAYRIDRADYPEVVIREAINNAIVHRDYYIGCDILVSLFDDRLDVMSIGGLMPGVTIPLMRSGISISRNEALSKIFSRLRLTDACGTGVPRIYENYEGYGLAPEFPITEGGFLISLPNINYILGELSESEKPSP